MSETEERSEKHVLIKTTETEKKRKKKNTVSQSLVLPNSFLLINNKEPKGVDAQVEYIP